MNPYGKILFLVLLSVRPLICRAQISAPDPLVHEFAVSYGLYGFREVNDAYLYKGTESAGVFAGRYTLHLDSKFSLGVEGAFEKTTPVLKGGQAADSLYINSLFLTGRLSYTLIAKERFRLYVSGAFGLKQIDKNIIGSTENITVLAKEFTLIGIQFRLLPKALIMAELTNGDIALLKFGLAYRFSM